MKIKNRLIAAALAAFLMLPIFGITAYAAETDAGESDEPGIIDIIETYVLNEAPETPESNALTPTPVTDYPETPPRPFTPSGTATVVDNATDSDGKEFYTITTPDEHVFYLVVDKQRNTDNVYFLNAVTIDDLMALAENPKPQQSGPFVQQPPAAVIEPPAEETPPPAETPQGGGNMGTLIFVAVIVVIGGGAGWCFKIYRPKQQGAASGDEYEPPMVDDESEYPDDWGDGQGGGDALPPWGDGDDE